MKKTFIYLYFILAYTVILSNPFLNAQYRDFEIYQETVSRQDIETKIARYLQQDPQLEQTYTITNQALHLADFTLRFGKKPKPTTNRFIPKLNSPQPMTGLRIAIDPGHVGGRMAKIERRYVEVMMPDDIKIQFDEGTLSVLTAKLIKALLTNLGATVMLTREQPGQAVYHQSFQAWCAQELGIISEQEWKTEETHRKVTAYLHHAPLTPTHKRDLLDIFRTVLLDPTEKTQLLKQALFRLCYNDLDLLARSKKINAFNPDLTLIIHYNASGACTSLHDLTETNYNLAFIPGSFLNGELEQQQARYEFIRLLVTDNLEESEKLSGAIVQNMKTVLQVPLQNSPTYLGDVTMYVAPGIYARNLVLTRLIHSPLCYGETLIQNNYDEIKRLAHSPRIAQVAQAYYFGICDYFGIKP